MPTGRSLHIGLNSIDPDHYDGWSGELSGCVNDALDMDALAHSRGFQRTRLLNEDATRERVLGALAEAIDSSDPGDLLLVTFSGHGSQLPDQNGDEQDGQDETWCLFDGEVLDDELWRLWITAKEHVRIVVLSDSCHSGTILKFAPLMAASLAGRPKNLPPTLANRVYRKNRAFYDALASKPAPNLSELQASVLLLSASLDSEVAWEGYGNGEFTSALLRAWNDGQFSGNYRELHRRIRKQLRDQTSDLLVLGNHTGALVSQAPFTI